MNNIFRHTNKALLCMVCPLALAISSVTIAQAETAVKGYQTPKFNFLRFNEDWSSLKGVDRKDLLPSERIKYIELSKNGNNWVSFGGHLRSRFENHRNFAFDAPTDADDSFILYRALFHADWHFGKQLRIFSCLLYTSPSPRDLSTSRMPSSA